MTLEYKTITCDLCGKKYLKATKYLKKGNRNYCVACQKKSDRKDNKERYKEYHKQYLKKWRTKKNDL